MSEMGAGMSGLGAGAGRDLRRDHRCPARIPAFPNTSLHRTAAGLSRVPSGINTYIALSCHLDISHGLQRPAREPVKLLVAVEFPFNRAFEFPELAEYSDISVWRFLDLAVLAVPLTIHFAL